MDEKKIAEIYDKLSDHDKRCVGLIGVAFLQGLIFKIKNVLSDHLIDLT